jgi:glycosyltransferase involved in cell wall biosynthesis
MLTYSFYQYDSRVQQYVNALLSRGDTVDVIALCPQGRPKFEIVDGVNVYGIQQRVRDERGPLTYLLRILRFFFHSALVISRRHIATPYQLIHVHSVPDFLVFAGLIPKLCGVPVILDIHDILPEFYSSKFNAPPDSLAFKLLLLVERASASFANHVIIANHLWHERLLSRAVRAEKCTPIRNYPDSRQFVVRPKRSGEKFVVMYPGTLNHHQGLDIAIKAFAKIKKQLPNGEFHIYGEGPMKTQLMALAADLGVNGSILFNDFVPVEQIAKLMADTDLAVVPKRASSAFGTEAASTKVFEFLALGVPVIVSRTKIDSFHFTDSTVKFFESENVDDLAQCMLQLAQDRPLRLQLAKNGLEYAQQNSWDVKQQDYVRLVDSMVRKNILVQQTESSNSKARHNLPLS